MKTIMTIASNSITYIEGDVKNGIINVSKYCERELPENVINNGAINDMDTLVQKVEEFIAMYSIQRKNIDFVMDSSRVLCREITVPKAKGSEMDAMVQNEILQVVGDNEEYVVDYILLGDSPEGETCKVIAYGVSAKIVESYEELLGKVKLRSKSLDFVANGIGKYISFLGGNADDSSIAFVIDTKDVSLALLDNSVSVLTRYIKINFTQFESFGTLDVAVEEMANNATRLMQFQKSRNREKPVSQAVILGDFSKNPQVPDMASGVLGLPCTLAMLPPDRIQVEGNFEPWKYAACLGVLVGRASQDKKKLKNDINFIKAHNAQSKKKPTISLDFGGASTKLFLLVGGLVAILLLFLAFLGIRYFFNSAKVNELNDYISNSEDAQRYTQIQELRPKLDSLNNYNRMVENVAGQVMSYPIITREEYDEIIAKMPADMSLASMNFTEGVFTITVLDLQSEAFYNYVTALRDGGKFFDIVYNGFSGSGEDGMYTAEIKCKLKGGNTNDSQQ